MWEKECLGQYVTNDDANSVLFAMQAIARHRCDDALWLRRVWDDTALRNAVLNNNIHMYLNAKRSGAYSMLSSGVKRIAASWFEGVKSHTLPLGTLDSRLRKSFWLYMPQLFAGVSRPQEEDISRLFSLFPDSLGGALSLYIGEQFNMWYREHQHQIFEMPFPCSDTLMAFEGLYKIHMDYQKDPKNAHAWELACAAWPEPCSTLTTFFSIFNGVPEMSSLLPSLAASFEGVDIFVPSEYPIRNLDLTI